MPSEYPLHRNPFWRRDQLRTPLGGRYWILVAVFGTAFLLMGLLPFEATNKDRTFLIGHDSVLVEIGDTCAVATHPGHRRWTVVKVREWSEEDGGKYEPTRLSYPGRMHGHIEGETTYLDTSVAGVQRLRGTSFAWRDEWTALAFLVIGFFAWGYVVTLWVNRLSNEHFLRRRGIRTRAMVVGTRSIHSAACISEYREWFLQYQYEVAGDCQTGSVRCNNPDALEFSALTIRYDAGNPADHVILTSVTW